MKRADTIAATWESAAAVTWHARPGASGGGVADQGTEAGQCLTPGPVVHPDTALFPVQQAAFVQHLEVVADGRQPGHRRRAIVRIGPGQPSGISQWLDGAASPLAWVPKN
jgi:hypothetical protein